MSARILLFSNVEDHLDHEALDLVLEGADLAHEVGGLVGRDAAADDSAADTAGAAKSHLAGNVNVGSVLVLAKKRQVEENGQRRSVGGEDDNLRDTSVEGLGGLVGTLLELAVVAGLLHKVEDLLGESLVGDGPCGRFGRHVVDCWWYVKEKGI